MIPSGFLLAAGLAWLSVWLTPIWILGVGSLLALAVLLLLWGVLRVVLPRAAAAVPVALTEGPLLPISWVVLAFAVFGVVGYFVADDRTEITKSITRVPFSGTKTSQLKLPAAPADADFSIDVPVPIRFRGDELRSIEISSNRDMALVIPGVQDGDNDRAVWRVAGGEEFVWENGIDTTADLGEDRIDTMVARNASDLPADVTIRIMTAPLHPQAAAALITMVAVLCIFLFYLICRAFLPKTSAIALATTKSEMAQPLFILLIVIGLFLLSLFVYLPYHTFGEDIKSLKNYGITLIMVFAILHCVWAAANSVSEEIEGRTAMTVLSKPIGRRQFILGKFLGIGWSSLVLFVLLGVWLLIVISYKPIYDARESANTAPTWQGCHVEVVRTVPGLALAFMESLIFAAIGVAISTRLPMLANFVICFSIYAFGHLTPLLVQAGEGKLETVRFFAQFIATVLPVLNQFNVYPAIAGGVSVPLVYLGTAALYCALYCTAALLLALVLFEDRDLA